MSARTSTVPVKLVRGAAAFAAVVLAVLIAVRFAARWQRRPEPAAPPLAEAKVDRKEAVRHQEFKDGRLQDEIRADRLYLGDDGLNHLEGAVDILDHGNAPGKDTEIHADAVAYDKDLSRFTMSGDVRIRTGDVDFSSPAVVYERKAGRFRTDENGAFSTPKLAGAARTVVYDEPRGEILLSGGFRVEVKEAGGPAGAASAVLEGDAFSYSRGAASGRADGRVHVTRRNVEAWADRLAFAATPDESSFSEMSFEGAARCVLDGGGEGKPGAAPASGGRTVEAAVIRVVSAAGSSRISAVEASGGANLVLRGPDDPGLGLSAETAVLAIGQGGGFERVVASGGVRVSLDAEPGEPRTIEAAELVYDKAAGTVTAGSAVAGGEPGRGLAVIESPRFRVEAPSLVFDTVRKNLKVSGPAVRCVLEPAKDSVAPTLFSSQDRVFVSSGRLAVSGRGGSRRLLFSGGARAWQGSRSIRAGILEIVEETGEASGREGVVISLVREAPAGAAGETIEAGGNDMSSSPKERSLVFTGKGFIRLPAAGLSGETVALRFDAKDESLASISAEGGVVIKKGDYEGRGGAARYDPREETIVLTGQPVLTTRDKGTSRGTRLTFRLGDGRILIENDGLGRSLTIVKS